MKHLLLVMFLSLMIFSNLSCTHVVRKQFNGTWEFLKDKDGRIKACLSKEDIKKLREVLIMSEIKD